MIVTNRLSKSMQLILTALFPPKRCGETQGKRPETVKESYSCNHLTVFPKELHTFFSGNGALCDPKRGILIFIPHVLPLTAPFLLFYLKRNGFSGCRAEVAHGGLVVHAAR
ncbi:MAG: hypothetical protein WCG31_02580 [Deltaproteobacteria bacterium]|jgi:hypothetical protein